MTDSNQSQTFPKLRLSSPEKLLATVPYLLGFHPRESLVVLGFQQKRLIFQSRTDLPPARTSHRAVISQAEAFVHRLRHQPIDRVILIGYGTEKRVTPMIKAAGRTAKAIGFELRDQLRVTNQRYWSYLCHDPACCPPEGTAIPLDDPLVTAETALAGLVAFPDRQALVESMAAPTGARLTAIHQANLLAAQQIRVMSAAQAYAAGEQAVAQALSRTAAKEQLSDPEVARLALLLEFQPQLLRQFITQLGRVDPKHSDWDTHQALWQDLICRADPTAVSAVAVLLAYTWWYKGDCIRAGIALDRAFECHPGSEPAATLDVLLQAGAQPPGIADFRSRSTGSGRVR